jgi:thiamine kinase-like enzyme
MPAQTLDLKALKAQLEKHLQQTHKHLEPIHLELLAHGEANVIYQLNQTFLVRVAVNTPNQRFEGDIRRVTQFEQGVLQYLQGTGISHELQGALLEPSDDFSYSYLITNFLEGRPLDYSRSHLTKCAHTLAQLHRLPQMAEYPIERLTPKMPIIQQPLTLFYNEAKAYAQPYLDSSQAEAEVVEMLQALLAKAHERLGTEALLEQYPYVCLVHSDHTYENWVINDRRAYLIDWEWAELSSPAGDLGHFLSPLTIRRYQDYRLPPEDREYFLRTYYNALEDERLAATVARHFAAFGVYPAVRSLCWTAGYWITAVRWYEAAVEDSPSASARLARLQESRNHFPELWEEVMQWLDEEI